MGIKQSKDMYILGIFCYFHDAGACLLRNGVIVAMAEEERFDRKKHSYSFPVNAIKYCLDKEQIDFSCVNSIAYGFIPWKILINQFFSAIKNFPKSLNLLRKGTSFMPFSEKIFGMLNLDKDIYKYFHVRPPKVTYIEHHTAHAYSTFFASPFEEAAILITDGYGENSATSFFYGKGNEIQSIGCVPYPNSLGVYYGTITEYLGFRPFHDEYKVMGMAAYGDDLYKSFFKKMLSINGEMGFKLDTSYTSFYTHGLLKWASSKIAKELGPKRKYTDGYEQRHFDIAKSAQTRLEDITIHLGKALAKITKSKNLCLAGGCAQNVMMNRKLLDNCGFENIFIPPVAYDGGISLGSAFAVYHRVYNGKRNFVFSRADWGPEYSDAECERVVSSRGLVSAKKNDLTGYIANLLANGKIVGFFDGGMEIGPRALGHRSILADPRQGKMKDILNSRIKKREFFRPFAPIVPLEDCNKYFDLDIESPFMALVGRVKKPDLLPAVTHKDGTARIQTVTQSSNKNIYCLLKRFGEITNIPVLLNTSFNENEPIVCSPKEAIDCFLRTNMDALVFNNRIIVESPPSSLY